MLLMLVSYLVSYFASFKILDKALLIRYLDKAPFKMLDKVFYQKL